MGKEMLPPISVEDILKSSDIYRIPIYQRNYAWGEKEISKIIEDICVNPEPYYLGNLIVANDEKDATIFDVIDGQQRLTTLFLICEFLKSKDVMEIDIDFDKKLRFEYRETFSNLMNASGSDTYKTRVTEGYGTISDILKKYEPSERTKFKEKLTKAQLLRISVPKGTNLNHYFEIMNTRGEQLELVDILKSMLIEKLDAEKREKFAEIWDVCSDMNEYVVKKITDPYIGYENERYVWKDYEELIKSSDNCDRKIDINLLLDELCRKEPPPPRNHSNKRGKTEDDKPIGGNYDSLVQFPEFLLHVLNILKPLKKNHLDEEKLLDRFKNVLNELSNEDKKLFSENFIINLLKYRFFYDMYIGRVKAKNDNVDNSEVFDIRRVVQTGDKYKKHHEKQTFDDNNIRAIQWALRITHTSQKSMHWITEMLEFITKDDKYKKEDFEKDYLTELESFIKKDIREYILDENNKINQDKLYGGLHIRHIIFAYIDYLLQKDNDTASSDYYYRFRTSLEHLYPQDDSRESFEKLKDRKLRDYLGNLFLLNRETNSHLSNISPNAKFEEMKDGMPPKLKKAKEVFENSGQKWADAEIIEHGKEMIALLEKNLMRE